jgi:hypothetical protein
MFSTLGERSKDSSAHRNPLRSPYQLHLMDVSAITFERNEMNAFQNPVQLLADLVAALDSTHWSSWQSTANFDKQLDAAREYVNQQRIIA